MLLSFFRSERDEAAPDLNIGTTLRAFFGADTKAFEVKSFPFGALNYSFELQITQNLLTLSFRSYFALSASGAQRIRNQPLCQEFAWKN